MSLLYIEDGSGVLENATNLKEEREKFNEELNDYIENHYKSDESEAMYALFNKPQVELLHNYFKGFSVELYKELNGTVELQIQKKSQKVKDKINKIAEYMGPIDLEDWVYDGMVDSGKNAGLKCDLCPRPVRYAHFAVNRKTSECLRFGCNCAADFFNMDKGTLSSMRTIQAQTLKDIKIIAYVLEKQCHEKYYVYLTGHVGKVYLESGEQGLRDLMTFMVQWKKDGTIEGDPSKDEYLVVFGDNQRAKKPLHWIKSNIVSCLNADLSDNIYDTLEDRTLKKISMKDLDKNQENTVGYIKYALRFLEVGLPIPLSLCKKVNSIVAKATRRHSNDYMKYAQELLISHNLAKSSLLRTAFTDFIVNYLASTIGAEKRDDELRLWNIRGQGTFYNTVLLWNAMVQKLIAIKEVKTLVNKGLISEEELKKVTTSRYFYNYKKYVDYVEDCMSLFLSNKEVVKLPQEVIYEGYSKYTLKGVDKKISVEPLKLQTGYKNTKDFGLKFSVDSIPINIGLHYFTIQEGYKNIVKNSIVAIHKFLKLVQILETDEDMMRYLCYLNKNSSSGVVHGMMDGYVSSLYTIDDLRSRIEAPDAVDEDLYKEMLTKYKGELKGFRSDCKVLYDLLDEITKNINKFSISKSTKVNATNINNDYEDLVLKKEKTNREYFQDYCDLLIAKRANKRMQPYMNKKNLYGLIAFKQLNPYADMLKDIQDSYIGSYQKEEEKGLFSYLRLHNLKNHLKQLLDVEDIEAFALCLTYLYCVERQDILKGYNKINSSSSLKDKDLIDTIIEELPKEIYNSISENISNFEVLYNELKELYIQIKSENLKFKEHYKLLKNQSDEVVKYLNTDEFKTVQMYKETVNKSLDDNIEYVSEYLGCRKLFSHVELYNVVSDTSNITVKLGEITDNYKENERLKEEELRVKGPLLDELKVALDEHIKFFEVDVNAERKKSPTLTRRTTDEAVRRKVAFKTIKYETSVEMIERFKNELKLLDSGKWSEGVSEVFDNTVNVGTLSTPDIKKYVDALRAENYNHKLIFNHYDLTYRILVELANLDLIELDNEEIKTLAEKLKVYYLLKSDMDYIYEVICKYSKSNIDYSNELSNLPPINPINIKDLLENKSDVKDSTGYTGVEKADLIKNHPDFDTLPDYLRPIIISVSKYKSCSPRQLAQVNKGFVQLGLGVIEENKDKEDSNAEDTVKEVQNKALEVLKHSDFDTLPNITKGVVTTLSKGLKAPSSKQLYHLEKAQKELGL